MISFILAALLICGFTLAFILAPLFKTRNTISYERQAQNIHFAQERLAELEAQLKNAAISATEYEALKLEIENTLAEDIDINQARKNNIQDHSNRSNKWLIIALVILLPLGALASYWQLGTPATFDQQRVQAPQNQQDVDALIKSVEQRLASQPDDVQGWRVLSRTYLATGQFEKAKEGFLRVVELEGDSAEIFISIADAAALQAGGDLTGMPNEYIGKALAIEPNHPQALWLAGLSAAQQNKFGQARENWSRLLPLLENNPEQQQELREIIAETLESEIKPEGIVTAPAQAQAQAQQNKPNDQLEVAANASITLRVSLSETLRSDVSAKDVVYVFARAENGPPAPLAVKQLTVASLPITLSLSDADAMLPQFKLSLFEQVVVSARVAKSGNPVAQKGDFESLAVTTSNQTDSTIDLEINQIVE